MKTWVWSLVQEDPQRKEWLPTPVFLSGEFHGQRSLVGYSPWCRRSDTIEWLTLNMSLLLYSSCCCHILYLKMFLSAIIPILRNLGGERSSIVLTHIFMFDTALLSFLKCQVSLNIISLLTEKLPLTFILEQWFSTGCYCPPKGNIWRHILLL